MQVVTGFGPERARSSVGVTALVLALSLIASACTTKTPIGVKRVGYDAVYAELYGNAIDSHEMSPSSKAVLYLLDLEEVFEDDPERALARLHVGACEEGRRPLLPVLAELSYLVGERGYGNEHFGAAAVYAYLYLFSTEDPEPPNPYSAVFRLCCDLYNRGLAKALPTADDGSFRLTGGSFELPFGVMEVEVSRPGFPWGEEAYDRFLPADAFSVRGMSYRVRFPGLGVPVIALPTVTPEDEQDAKLFDADRELPATGFLRVEGGMDGLRAGELTGSLEIYSGFGEEVIEVAGRQVPLEADITAPLAHSLEQSPLWSLGLRAFLSGRSDSMEPGLYSLRPYEPGKIPVVFVHGTASSPALWAEAFNGLLADSRLRSQCQFWFFLYETGNPIVYSTSRLRASLRETLKDVDPDGEDAALQRMVVIGHSQGGMLTRMIVCDSGEAFWDSLASRGIDLEGLDDDQRDALRNYVVWEHEPYVERVVFVATPHRGSFVAGGIIGWLANKLSTLSGEVTDLMKRVTGRSKLPPEVAKEIPTSVDNMTPKSPFVKVLSAIPIERSVKYHSIIAIKGKAEPPDGNNGVVTYKSAHVLGAQSELIVRSGHSCQGKPATIFELRRILLEHLQGDGRDDGP